MNRTFTMLISGLTMVLAAAGCGPSGPKLVSLSGTVTFKGEPVPAGYVVFTPPSGGGSVRSVPIRNGRYNTAEIVGAEKGVHPGPNQVRITGFNGKKEPFYADGKQIFNPVQEQFTVPEAGGTKDFVIPESAGKNVKIEPTSDD
ncbi:MAG: hypothetical protein MUF18_10295 [Fimbriiglobus sp.]|nr:hypothetical protein [Fimbriiglobus sp.]